MGNARALSVVLLLAVMSGAVFGEKLKVGFYSESYCPYCVRYLDQVLMPLIRSGMLDNVDFEFVPAGNMWRRNGTLFCQHGAKECVLNTMLNCAIQFGDNITQIMEYTHCIESHRNTVFQDESVAEDCASEFGFDSEAIQDCTLGEEGEVLLKTAYRITENLVVPHRWVPWVVVNEVPLYDAMDFLTQIVCMVTPPDDRIADCYRNPWNSDEKLLSLGDVGKNLKHENLQHL